MKVLKRGDWPSPKGWKHTLDCSRCKSSLECEVKDIYYQPPSEDHPVHYTPEQFYLICAVCEDRIKIDPPLPIMKAVRKRHTPIGNFRD